jgi:hypothetical protein
LNKVVEGPANRASAERVPRIALLVAWALFAGFLACHHVPWRDEVRAFSIALQGDDVVEMLRGLQGEGHPAIWYLLLRGAHFLSGVREALPATAFLIASAGMALLALKAPLRIGTIALFMLGGLAVFEYSVSARNYGISMTILFAIAALYPRWRDRGVLIGLLLALLCNTNVPATFLAAALLGFWLVELVGEEGLSWHRKYALWLANAAIAAAGAAICFVTVFPTVHDAASLDHPGGIGIGAVLHALATPGTAFRDLGAPWMVGTSLAAAMVTILLAGSLAGLARAPAAFLAGLGVTLFFQLFYQLVYPGSYRHEGLLIVFLLALHWLVAAGRGGRWPAAWRQRADRMLGRLAGAGGVMFALLLALQLPTTLAYLSTTANGIPYSRAGDLAALLEREGLGNAVLIADPDVLLEPLPYHVDNLIWLHREQRFGQVVRFTAKNIRIDIRLDDILDDARKLAGRTARPVVIVLRHGIDPDAPPRWSTEPYVGRFITDPDQVRRFLAATRRLAAFGPAKSDETYEVYLLTSAAGG